MCFTNMEGPQVEISGLATLCFDEAGTWFQGSIAAEDDTQYVIYGTKSKRLSQGQPSAAGCECGSYDDGPGVPVTFDIRVMDCEVGEEYSLKRVHGRNGELCTFACASVTFTTDKVYRGQKADMIAQRCLGHKMTGRRNHVYRGPIKIRCVAVSRNAHWVL
ncbi:uncharacterized protein LOC121860098 [Homarus americanus]|uniref:Uncharacterized protein n=1 Tax=Homarus americanus TaxID=6706 RepID=A0A8J5N5Z9_HOMAM|nr:uncharacterized protein LOC121860098 [Homarus americanus]XP_042213065.1 uncharacterized protein LOC121860098 [Homarus americanus]KAG7173799.1 hypothetical protein Hamer_G021607 [Homarus americanus]